MEDVLKFLLVAAVMVAGLVRQFKQEAKKNAEKKAVPLPDEGSPLPEEWDDDTYGGFIPQSPRPAAEPEPVSQPSAASARGAAKASPSQAPPRAQETDETPPEYGIHSAEEARKAVVWAEIFQRKY